MAQYNQEHGVGAVVDIGAGKGYISQVLEYYYSLPVVNLEAATSHFQGASLESITRYCVAHGRLGSEKRSVFVQKRLWKEKVKKLGLEKKYDST